MSRAFTRRAALQGTAAAALGLATGTAPARASVAPLDPADARLIALADAAEDLERTCNARTAAMRTARRQGSPATDEEEDAFAALSAGFLPIEQEIAATPAATMVGVLAKARAAQVATMRAFDACPFGLSIADDLVRLAPPISQATSQGGTT